MITIVNVVPKPYLCIIDSDYYYALRIKYSLGKRFHEGILVTVFRTTQSAVESISRLIEKPLVILIGQEQSNMMPDQSNERNFDVFHRISPNSKIILLSDENQKDGAVKVPANEVPDNIWKDQFAFEHIFTAVEKCIHPSKIL